MKRKIKCEGGKQRIMGKKKAHTLKRIYEGEGGKQKVRIVLREKIKCMTGKLNCEGRVSRITAKKKHNS